MSSIVADDEAFPFDFPIVWKRPADFAKSPKIFSGAPDPKDLRLGIISNGWFLCAVACLSENTKLIERLFVT